MSNEYSALDTETLENLNLVQPQENVQHNTPADTEKPDYETGEGQNDGSNEPTQEPNDDNDGAQTTLNIEGLGEVSLDDIKEWQKGYLRQSDYTKKTQNLAMQRAEAQEAIQLYNFLQNNPQVYDKLLELDQPGQLNTSLQRQQPDMLKELWYNQKSMQIDMQMNYLREKYGDIDEVSVFNKAAELGTEDLEEAYKIVAFDGTGIDRQQMLQELKEELQKELQANRQATRTVVSAGSQRRVENVTNLTDEEIRVALNMGLTEAEYAKWKNR